MQQGVIKKKHQIAILISGTIILCLVILINIMFQEALFIQGINFIYAYQKAQPYGILQVIQNIFSLLCNPLGIGVIVLVYYMAVNRKLMLIVHLSYFLFGTYIMALLKQAFQQSRPIWFDHSIENWQWFCPKDFGNPSGHSYAVMMLYEPIISDYLGYGRKYWAAFPLFVIGIMVPISRMYLGVHSANQIMFGLTSGLICLILFKYIYQKQLYYLYWEMLMENTHLRYLKIAGLIFLNILCILIPILFFQLNVQNRPMAQNDISNLNFRCGTQLTGYEVQAHILVACCINCFFFGLLYGFILMSDSQGYRKYMLGLWKYENCIKVTLKIAIYIFSLVPALIVLLIGTIINPEPVIKYLIACFGVLLAGIGLSYWAPILAQKCKVIQLLPGYPEDYQHKYDDV